MVVEGVGSRIEAPEIPSFGTRFGPENLENYSDAPRPACSTHPGKPRNLPDFTGKRHDDQWHDDHHLRLGSGTNENQFLIDGTNFTCPCNGVARSEAGVDFIQEIQVQSVGASAESRERSGRRHQRHHAAGRGALPV